MFLNFSWILSGLESNKISHVFLVSFRSQVNMEEIDEMVVKQQLIDDQQRKELIEERSSPLRKYDIHAEIQPPAHERGDDYR